MHAGKGIILGLAIALATPVAAEAAIFRLRSGGLDALTPPPLLQLKRAPPRHETPLWLQWALKWADGSMFSLPQPAWEGPLAAPGSLWRLGLDLGYKGRPNLGVGPTVALMGRIRWAPWVVDGQVSLLATQRGLGAMTELSLSAAPVQLQFRVWTTPGISRPGQSVMLRLTQRF